MIRAAVDNDVLKKGICYGIFWHLVRAIPAQPEEVGLLGTARYVIGKRLKKANLSCSVEVLLQRLEEVLQRTKVLEPTATELHAAAELEYAAQVEGLQLDAGESQLCAIVIARKMEWLVTGDKRAIAALERLLALRHEIRGLAGKLVCLEQLVRRLLAEGTGAVIRAAICGEPSVDKALSFCFSCTNPTMAPESWIEGLTSYINDVRRAAPTLMVAS